LTCQTTNPSASSNLGCIAHRRIWEDVEPSAELRWLSVTVANGKRAARKVVNVS
jgi:hypothetical protein